MNNPQNWGFIAFIVCLVGGCYLVWGAKEAGIAMLVIAVALFIGLVEDA